MLHGELVCEYRHDCILRYMQGSTITLACNNEFDCINEPPHDKTNKMTCASSEDSDQPVQPRIQALFKRTAKTLIRLGGCLG